MADLSKHVGSKLDDVLDNIEVPSVRNDEFNKWFDDLSVDDFQKIWSDPKLRETIKARIRQPGGLHEWLMVARADTFKR